MSIHDPKLDARGMPLHPHRGVNRARWTSFASVLLVILGALHVLQALGALLGENFYTSPKGYFLGGDSVDKWGWAHLLLGLAALAAGLGLWRRVMWARGVAVGVATIGMFANFLWLPFAPAGALVLIVLDIFVMWAAFADLHSDNR